jgi:hypothetical protein
LNKKQGADNLTVAAAYPNHVFRYHFDGTSWPMRQDDWTGLWLKADYVVSYFSYAQRGIPSPEVVDYFTSLEPEYVALINGIEYAQVYKVPQLVMDDVPPISHVTGVNLDDKVTFLGYDLHAEQVEPGGDIEMTLYWQRRQPLDADYSVYLRLLNGAYQVFGGQDGGPLWGAMPTSLWEENVVLADQRRLQVLPGTPPGVYQIEIGMYDPTDMYALEPLDGKESLLLGSVEVVRGMTAMAPEPQVALEANLENKVGLVGYELEGEAQPGSPLRLTLLWEALAPMDEDYTVFVHLLGEDGEIWGQRDSQPVAGYYPTSLWIPGEFVRDQYDLTVAEEALSGTYTLRVGMYHPGTGKRLQVLENGDEVVGDGVSLGAVQVERR